MDLKDLDRSGAFSSLNEPFDPIEEIGFSAGDILVVPASHRVLEMPRKNVREYHTLLLPALPWLATMHREAGAGFYMYSWGPLPFFVGPVSPEKYTLYEIVAADSGGAAEGEVD